LAARRTGLGTEWDRSDSAYLIGVGFEAFVRDVVVEDDSEQSNAVMMLAANRN
jgi:hypothetical protein